MKRLLTQKAVKAVLHYDQETGTFTWLVDKPNAPKGTIAGTQKENGYIRLHINNRGYYAHRVAYLYMEGRWPAYQLDHDNGNRSDNSWKNLKPATNSANSKNAAIKKNNSSGLTGVSWYPRRNRWQAMITVNRHQKSLGRFHDLFNAACVRKSAELQYGFHENHGNPNRPRYEKKPEKKPRAHKATAAAAC